MDRHGIATTADEQAEWGRGGVRGVMHKECRCWKSWRGELPGTPTKSGKGVAAAGREIPGLDLDRYGVGEMTPYSAENRAMPDPCV